MNGTNHSIHEDGRDIYISQDDQPWLPKREQQCRYKVCPRCRPSGADRAFLSLDAVANGEIPPTSVVGYGFLAIGERPVVGAEILKMIGLPKPPRVRA